MELAHLGAHFASQSQLAVPGSVICQIKLVSVGAAEALSFGCRPPHSAYTLELRERSLIISHTTKGSHWNGLLQCQILEEEYCLRLRTYFLCYIMISFLRVSRSTEYSHSHANYDRLGTYNLF